MQAYLTVYYIFFGVGILMLGAGMALREKVPPPVAAMLVVIGTLVAMVFMNLAIFMGLSIPM